MLGPLVDEVLHQLRDLDPRTEALSRGTGLRCPAGCGACCLSPEVESTVLELLPAARELLRSGEVEAWLARLGRGEGSTRCVLYAPEVGDERSGRCALYPVRPAICRLYGFAARRNRRGVLELLVCRVHRSSAVEEVERAKRRIEEDGEVVVLSDVHFDLAALHPGLGSKLMPINDALRSALELLALEERLASAERAGEERPEVDPEPRPIRPPRAA